MRIVLLGPPGAGKGTQAARLAAHLGVPHIATGDMLRQAANADTPLGRRLHSYMDRGDLVPDDLTNAIVEERISQPDVAKGFVLDGYPRSVDQAKMLDESLAVHGVSLDKAIASDSTFAMAHFFKAMVLFQGRHEPATAIPEFEAFLATNPPPDAVKTAQTYLSQAQAAVAAAQPKP